MQFTYIDFLILILLLRVSWIDILYRRIGKAETCLLSVLGVIRSRTIADSLAGGVICSVFPEAVNLLFSDLTGLGGGDIRMMFAAGCLLGIDGGLDAVLVSGVLMLSAAGCGCILKRENPAGWKLPYGPFLSVGIIILLLRGK